MKRSRKRIMTFINILLGVAFLLLLIIFFLPVFGGVLNIGNVCGMIFCCIMIFVFWGNSVFLKIVSSLRENRIGRIGLNIIVSLFVIVFIYICFLTGLIIHADNTPPKNDCTVIVLGCQVRGDHPSLMLMERINSAADYLKENPDVKCIVSGGKGDDENISEAECMRRILLEKGISPDRIIIEDRSTNTAENISFSKKIIEENALSKNTAIVTDIFHEYRASKIVKDAGLVYGSVPAKCVWYLFPTFYVRELIAITASFVGLA